MTLRLYQNLKRQNFTQIGFINHLNLGKWFVSPLQMNLKQIQSFKLEVDWSTSSDSLQLKQQHLSVCFTQLWERTNSFAALGRTERNKQGNTESQSSALERRASWWCTSIYWGCACWVLTEIKTFVLKFSFLCCCSRWSGIVSSEEHDCLTYPSLQPENYSEWSILKMD